MLSLPAENPVVFQIGHPLILDALAVKHFRARRSAMIEVIQTLRKNYKSI